MRMLDVQTVLFVFVVTLAIGRLTMMDLRPVTWKKVEMFIIGIAACGIIGATYKAQSFMSTAILQSWQRLAVANGDYTLTYAENARQSACADGVDYEDLSSRCYWLAQNAAAISNAVKALQPISLSVFEGAPSDPDEIGSVPAAAPYFIAISAALKLTQLWAEIRQEPTT